MKVIDNIKSKNIDEFAEWIDKYGLFDGSPWMNWWNDNYCKNCEEEIAYVPYLKRKSKCCWCELHGKCRFFQDMNDIPNIKDMIKMWLESEI